MIRKKVVQQFLREDFGLRSYGRSSRGKKCFNDFESVQMFTVFEKKSILACESIVEEEDLEADKVDVSRSETRANRIAKWLDLASPSSNSLKSIDHFSPLRATQFREE